MYAFKIFFLEFSSFNSAIAFIWAVQVVVIVVLWMWREIVFKCDRYSELIGPKLVTVLKTSLCIYVFNYTDLCVITDYLWLCVDALVYTESYSLPWNFFPLKGLTGSENDKRFICTINYTFFSCIVIRTRYICSPEGSTNENKTLY